MAAAAKQKQQQPPPPARGSDCGPLEICGFILGTLLLLPILFVLVVMCLRKREPPEYSVAITGATGLVVDRNNATAALDPAFDITVRVASRSRDPACLHPATSAQVSYLRVPLAGGSVRPAAGRCAPPWKSADLAFVARGKAVAVPGYLPDSFAEDMRTGQAVFEVTLMSPAGRHWIVHTCWGKIGDAAALDYACATSWVDADQLAGGAAARPAW